MSTITFAAAGIVNPPRIPRGRPFELPAGLDDKTIERLRLQAEKLTRAAAEGSFPIVYCAKVLAALVDKGYARLSVPEIFRLSQSVGEGEMPAPLARIIVSFIGRHPPLNCDGAAIAEAIDAGRLGARRELIALHQRRRDRVRKQVIKRKVLARLNPDYKPRPVLLKPAEREARRLATEKQRAAEALAEAQAVWPILWKHRFHGCFAPWHREFLECADALVGAGYGLVPRQVEVLLEMHRHFVDAGAPAAPSPRPVDARKASTAQSAA